MNTAQERLKSALIKAGVKEEIAANSVSYYVGQPDFSPTLPVICPICKCTRLVDVELAPGRRAKYCTSDRSVYPYPVTQEVSPEKIMKSIDKIKSPVKEDSIFVM